MRILIVDDEPMMREVLCAGLQHQGHSSVSAESAAEALVKINFRCPQDCLKPEAVRCVNGPDFACADWKNKVDAVICDGLNGEWLAVYRAARYQLREMLPFVLLTGDGDLYAMALAMEIPALLKPAPIVVLLAALQTPVGVGTR